MITGDFIYAAHALLAGVAGKPNKPNVPADAYGYGDGEIIFSFDPSLVDPTHPKPNKKRKIH